MATVTVVVLCFATLLNLPIYNAHNHDIILESVRNDRLVSFRQEDGVVAPRTLHKRSVDLPDVGVTEDPICSQQSQTHLGTFPPTFINKYTFMNETKFSLALTWTGDSNHAKQGRIIVAVTEEVFIFVRPSTLYLSSDEGKTFTNISSRIDDKVIRKENGLQNHPLHENIVFILVHANQETSLMYRSTDAGDTFAAVSLPFSTDGDFKFHPTDPDFMLAVDREDRTLYISKNCGQTWSSILSNVMSYKWTTWDGDNKYSIYATTNKDFDRMHTEIGYNNDLMKSSDEGLHWSSVHATVYSFGMQGKFLYISRTVPSEENTRLMEVSTDGGAHWNEVQLPYLTTDRFYSILDMSEELIFMHVDNPGDTGHGVLYTSDASGIVFTKSLQKHLYPNYGEVTDFYRVRSMRGVYLASQMGEVDPVRGASIHTVISFDRGGEWRPVRRPENVPCKDEAKACSLQIHNQFSAVHQVNGFPPLSVENAPGLILVHGHVADALQMTNPDVFVSSDGGYNWRLALKGPHNYQIADQGGLLIAVPSDTPTPNTVKFSTDEGRCWHSYKFTEDPVIFRRLLTEPENKAMTVAVWGYMEVSRQWKVFVMDFKTLIQTECIDVNYEEWQPHSTNNEEARFKGCLLGKRETYMRLKKDSWCYNGYAREVARASGEICQCSKADYDCDYGYYRPVGMDDCVTDPSFNGAEISICHRNHMEKFVYQGYHKIPGDVCSGGFTPKVDKIIDLKTFCASDTHMNVPSSPNENALGKQYNGRLNFFLAAFVVVGFLLFIVAVVILVRRNNLLGKVRGRYKYSSLQAGELDLEATMLQNNSLYEDSSDEETPVSHKGLMNGHANPRPTETLTFDPFAPQSSNSSVGFTSQQTSPKVKSYHDDSDEDLLE